MGLTAALVTAGLATFPHAARADGAHAEQSFNEGVRLYDKKAYDKAADAFARAYAEDPRGKFLWNLAVAELKAGAAWPALRHLRAYKTAPDATKAHLDAIDALIESARANVGHVVIEAPSGYAVAIDGTPVGVAPLASPVDVEPGVDHDASADQGASHLDSHVKVAGAQTASVRLEATPPAEAPPPTAPVAPPAQSQVTPTQHEDASANISPSGANTTRNIVVVSAGGAALVAAGLGVAYALVAVNNDANTANADLASVNQQAAKANVPSTSACSATPLSPGCAKLQSDLQKWQSDRNIGIGLYVTAGVLAAAAIGTFFLWPKPRGAEAAWFVPELAPGMAGVDFRAHF
jgi:hypothetical protein